MKGCVTICIKTFLMVVSVCQTKTKENRKNYTIKKRNVLCPLEVCVNFVVGWDTNIPCVTQNYVSGSWCTRHAHCSVHAKV